MLSEQEVRQIVVDGLESLDLRQQRVLLIVPDATRTAPVGQMFRLIHEQIGHTAKQLDVMIALGTHPPMSEEAICKRLEITTEQRRTTYSKTQVLNHRWNDPDSLIKVGTLPASQIGEISEGAFAMDVDVTVNRAVFDYDHLLIVGPVFPHEVAGFSGGAKYLFPGISGPELLNFFHWLGAVITNYKIIGHKWTPVRAVIHAGAALVKVPCHAFCMVVRDHQLAGLFFGLPIDAWSKAADLSADLHIVYTGRLYKSVLSNAPEMYQDMWVGGKCMYKLEPVVEPGGELIVYAPHIKEVSVTHGHDVERIGYHVCDYFTKQWDRFKDEPWSVLAHSTHVKGRGTYENGIETANIQVTLATGIPEEICRKINLGYRDPASIDPADFEGREEEGVLLVRNAGETLYRPEKDVSL